MGLRAALEAHEAWQFIGITNTGMEDILREAATLATATYVDARILNGLISRTWQVFATGSPV